MNHIKSSKTSNGMIIKKVNEHKKQYNIEWEDFLKYEWGWTI